MVTILKLFMDILLFRLGPEDVPVSIFLLKASAVFYFVVGVLLALLNFSFLSAVGVSAIDTALLSLLVWITLKLKNFDNRFIQTLTAACGALGLLTVIVLPLDILYALLDVDDELESLFSIMMMSLTAWSVTVLGHILRNSLDIVPSLAVGLSILYLVVSFIMTVLLFSVPVSA